MIIDSSQLSTLSGKVAMVDGGFDPLHAGHIGYFREAAKLGLPVLCNVRGDDYMVASKRRANLLPEDQRAVLLDSLEMIDYVHVCQTSTRDVLEQLAPVKYVKGSDWRGKLPEAEQELCRRLGIEIVFLDTVTHSSTEVMGDFLARVDRVVMPEAVARFEKLLSEQSSYDPEHYDSEYFQGDWREGENDYSLDRRREIEGKNPQNIRDVFQPASVLDVGCGPGALMYFLHELGLEVHGVDFSAGAKALAPAEVRENIVVAPMTEYVDFEARFDLVICREVLEHLTVREVREAARVLTRYTSKYLYITTRYHPNPHTLLDVTTDFVTDPSHITLMNKHFMRVLFALEGLRSRPDLEQAMDWKNYGRVLVFEKVGK